METATDPDGRLAAAFHADRALLFALCNRPLGTAADAKEIGQETFARARERPPPDTDRAWRPWLVRVAVRLCLDSLRRRRRRSYPGPWLPGVVATGDEEPAPPSETPEQRYGLRESATVAFLLALEALRPAQRAVLILCDAFGYSAREASEAIDTSEGNARVLLHRTASGVRRLGCCSAASWTRPAQSASSTGSPPRASSPACARSSRLRHPGRVRNEARRSGVSSAARSKEIADVRPWQPARPRPLR